MEYLIPVVLLFVALLTGRWAEARHYRSIQRREAASLARPAVTFRRLPEGPPVRELRLATGSVVISVDLFKRFLAGFRMVFGGEMRSYSSLLDRARREALLRMKESCPDAALFLNCRIETSSIYKGEKNTVSCVEMLAYGTAVIYADEVHPQAAG